MRILGIDPGSTSMGFAIIDETVGVLKAIEYGTTAIKDKELTTKLLSLSKALEKILDDYKPDAAGVEQLFFSKNKKTAFEVAQARGVILITLLKRGIPLHEFTPAQIKIAVTNYGGSDKQMVAKMVMKLLGLPKLTGDDNAADALATAIATSGALRRKF